jgi:hypothetical protein
MGYARSAAFKAFQTHVSASRRVVKAAGKISFGGKRRKLYQDSMLSSSILLCFANFENYLSDVIDDMCIGFCAAALTASGLPPELRTQVAVVSKLAEWADIEDPTKLQANLWKYKEGGGFAVLDDAFVPKNINVDAITAKITYPKIDNVIKVMRRIGIQKPKAKLKAVGGHAIEQKLTSIHDARAELAHTGKLPVWTTQDYVDRLNDLETFARTLDKIFCQHFCRYASLPKWIK